MTIPFVMPDPFSFSRRVLAHYFQPFPLSIDNQPAASDYYNRNYLAPSGENGKFLAQGGYLRARPLPVTAPNPSTDWQQENMESEVSMAIARGITGFNYDILIIADTRLPVMLAAAQAVDPRFGIIPMLDMSSLGNSFTASQAISMIASFNHPSFMREPDGRLIVTAFNPTQPLSYWQQVISGLNAQNIDIAFIPVLLGSPTTSQYASLSIGTGGWGTATPASALAPASYMTPVLPQQFRPKDGIFWEASNFDTFRNAWASAIAGALAGTTQYAQIITWNDFSESGQVQPFTDATLATNIGTGFYDLSAYYATWFMSGIQPSITKDALYWCYRRMPCAALHANQSKGVTIQGGTEVENFELLAFLTLPGTLVINGQTLQAPAGITSFKVPATPGKPVMALQRNGSDVHRASCPLAYYGLQGSPAGTLDLTYWSGSL